MVFPKSSHSESCLFGFKISWLFQHSLIICEVSVWCYRRRIWCFKTWQATRQQHCRDLSDKTIRKYLIQICWFREFSITYNKTLLYCYWNDLFGEWPQYNFSKSSKWPFPETQSVLTLTHIHWFPEKPPLNTTPLPTDRRLETAILSLLELPYWFEIWQASRQ